MEAERLTVPELVGEMVCGLVFFEEKWKRKRNWKRKRKRKRREEKTREERRGEGQDRRKEKISVGRDLQ